MGLDDLGVDKFVQPAFHLDDAGAQLLAQLWGGQPDARGVTHGVGQVVEQLGACSRSRPRSGP